MELIFLLQYCLQFPSGLVGEMYLPNNRKHVQNTDMVTLVLMQSCLKTLNCSCYYVSMELGSKFHFTSAKLITSHRFVLLFPSTLLQGSVLTCIEFQPLMLLGNNFYFLPQIMNLCSCMHEICHLFLASSQAFGEWCLSAAGVQGEGVLGVLQLQKSTQWCLGT